MYFIILKQNDKPGYVVNDHLSRTTVTSRTVVSYTAFPPLPRDCKQSPEESASGFFFMFPCLAVYFCCTGLGVTSTGRYPASCPMKPGLSSPVLKQPRSFILLKPYQTKQFFISCQPYYCAFKYIRISILTFSKRSINS